MTRYNAHTIHEDMSIRTLHLSLDLRLQDVLEGDSVSRELGDTLPKLLRGHGLLVELETEQRLVVDVAALGDVLAGGVGGVQLLGDSGGRVVQLLKEVGLRDVG